MVVGNGTEDGHAPPCDKEVAETITVDDDLYSFAEGNAATSDSLAPPAATSGTRRPRALSVVASSAPQEPPAPATDETPATIEGDF
jgi:hypothetical protein